MALSIVQDKPKSALEQALEDVAAADAAADADQQAAIQAAKDRDAAAFDEASPPAEPPKRNRPPKAPAPEPEPAMRGAQAVMPGFDGALADEVVINVSGRLVLNLANAEDARLWAALRPESTVFCTLEGMNFDAFVSGSAGKVARDKDGEVKTRRASKSVTIDSKN